MSVFLLNEQRLQFSHDAEAGEVGGSRMARFKSCALRFSPMVAAAFKGGQDSEEETALTAESFALALSTANVLAIDLGKELSQGRPRDARPFPIRLADAAGSLADAAEKIDHLEEFAVQAREAVLGVTRAVMDHAAATGVDLSAAVAEYRDSRQSSAVMAA